MASGSISALMTGMTGSSTRQGYPRNKPLSGGLGSTCRYLSVGPGSAAHHHSVSKTRVNALMVLRRVRDTVQRASGAPQIRDPRPASRQLTAKPLRAPLFPHQIGKAVEQIVRVARARRGFRV